MPSARTKPEKQSPSRRGEGEFPIQCYMDALDKYELGHIPWHWHPQAEFLVVLEGHVRLYVHHNSLLLAPGEGVFINADALHMARTEDCDSALIRCVMFDPTFVSGPPEGMIYERYAQPLLRPDSAIDYRRFAPDDDWQTNLLKSVLDACCLEEDRPAGYDLQIFARISDAWTNMLQHLPNGLAPVSRSVMEDRRRIRTMVAFIHKNYSQPVTLQKIADEADISISEALRCFRRWMDTTPIAYLMYYRVERATRLLRENAQVNTEYLARACGFNSASYFCKVFRDFTGMNATQYQFRSTWSHARHSREGSGPPDYGAFTCPPWDAPAPPPETED